MTHEWPHGNIPLTPQPPLPHGARGSKWSPLSRGRERGWGVRAVSPLPRTGRAGIPRAGSGDLTRSPHAAGPGGSGEDVTQDDGLELRHLLQGVAQALPAQAAHLVATERRVVGAVETGAVEADHAGLDAVAEVNAAGQVAREDGRAEAEV